MTAATGRGNANGNQKQAQTGSMSTSIFVLNGPNLNLLGEREPEIYGRDGLDTIRRRLEKLAAAHDMKIDFRQSNIEGELVDWIHEAGKKGAPVILNAAAYTHTSIALHDAIKAVDIICIEVHLSNIFKRESFRHNSFVASACDGGISGLGIIGYELALLAIKDRLGL
jgi:3-dehydroquinate dehydratase-2